MLFIIILDVFPQPMSGAEGFNYQASHGFTVKQ